MACRIAGGRCLPSLAQQCTECRLERCAHVAGEKTLVAGNAPKSDEKTGVFDKCIMSREGHSGDLATLLNYFRVLSRCGQVLPVAIRGKAMSVVVCINRLMSGIIALSYQSMSDAMSIAGSFYFFGMLSALSIAFYYFCVSVWRGSLFVSLFLARQNLLGLSSFRFICP